MSLNRREFIRLGGLVVLSSVMTTACSSSSVDQRGVPGRQSGPTAFTTNSGTAASRYDVSTDAGATSGLAGRAVLHVPDTALATDVAAVPVALTAHGFEEDAMWLDASETAPMRDALLDAGYVLVSPYYEATFGNVDGQDRMRRARAYVGDLWDVSGTVLIGFSMGGGISAVALHQQTLSDVRAAFLIDPVLNWGEVHQTIDDDFTYRASAAMFNAFDATEQDEFLVNTARYDPVRQPASAYAGIRALVRSSPDDNAVDRQTNALAWISLVSGQARQVYDSESSGEHGSANHFSNTTELVAFFDQAIAAGE